MPEPTNTPPAAKARPRIIFAPWQEHDGQWCHAEPEIVEEPRKIEIEDGWVHIVAYDSLGTRSLYRSYPARIVEKILWMGT